MTSHEESRIPRNVLIVRTGGLGDCILTLPAVSLLGERFPGARFHVLGNGAMLDIARLAGGFESLRPFDEAGFASLFSGAEPGDFLRSYFSRFDDVRFFSAADPVMIARTVTAAGAGFCTVLDPRPPEGFRGHAASHLQTIAGERQASPPELPELPPGAFAPDVIPRLVIHPGSGSVRKTWPVERFVALAERWEGDLLFLLGPAEEERGVSRRIPSRFAVLRSRTIREAAETLARSALHLGCDSGTSHLAALCGTPSVVLFGPSDPAVWRPLGKKTTVMRPSSGLLEDIGVEEVLKTLRERAGS
jgi:heptosyltransferase III